MPLIDASHHARRGAWPAHRLAEAAPALFWAAPGVNVGDALSAETGPKSIAVTAYVNAGRWVVSCPDCNGAQLAARDDRRFLCNECGNAVVGGLWRPVVWPTDRQIKAIEGELEKRPLLDNRHWSPGETAADLRRETAANLERP